MHQTSDKNKRIAKNSLLSNSYERRTIQRIAESLHKGGFSKYDKGRYTTKVP